MKLQKPGPVPGDETAKIFLNTRGILDDVDMEMLEFLTYVENTTDAFAAQTASPLVKEIHKRVTEVKQSREVEVEYMTLFQRDRENIELGREEGLEQGQRKMAVLTKILLSENRMEDLKRALEDKDFCNKLFADNGI